MERPLLARNVLSRRYFTRPAETHHGYRRPINGSPCAYDGRPAHWWMAHYPLWLAARNPFCALRLHNAERSHDGVSVVCERTISTAIRTGPTCDPERFVCRRRKTIQPNPARIARERYPHPLLRAAPLRLRHPLGYEPRWH